MASKRKYKYRGKERPCQYCKEVFIPKSRFYPTKYCSHSCRAKDVAYEKKCEVCSGIMLVRSNVQKYCKPCHDLKEKEWSKDFRSKMTKEDKKRKNEKEKVYRQNPVAKAKHTACQRRREIAKKKAVPLWFNEKEVQFIYLLAKERKLEADHIVPLRSKYVCGLHVQDNLRCIPKELNRKKRNAYWPDMVRRIMS